ncbi:coenzyme Q-binding protein COQ10 [Azospirillaceae bacterium]
MPTHAENRFVPYTAEQMFRLVAEVDKYPEFLPWCVGARIKRRQGNTLIADLMIGFRMVRESFTSRVTLSPSHRIDTTFSDGPFQYLKSYWIFHPVEGGCNVDFFVEFEFKSKMLQNLISVLFNEATRRMVAAFDQRARHLYGPSEPI